jgi:hypothetical protein
MDDKIGDQWVRQLPRQHPFGTTAVESSCTRHSEMTSPAGLATAHEPRYAFDPFGQSHSFGLVATLARIVT